MEISNVQLVKPFGPLVMMAELPETVIKSCNEIVDVIKDRKDMGDKNSVILHLMTYIKALPKRKKVCNKYRLKHIRERRKN